MKRFLITAVMLTLVSAASFGEKVVAKGQTFTSFGDYKVIRVDEAVPMMGKDCQAYTIKYENSPLEVKVIVCKEKNCRTYLVLSDKLSVQYVCHPEYFGVEKVNKKFEPMGYSTSDKNLNRLEYFHQKVLGPGQKTELEATSLIAAYFTYLLLPEQQA
ncbi:MAG: hypothetical protein U0X39_15170 [Bacteroidales bacterium]